MALTLAVDEGSGPLVVLLHGFPELPSCFRNQVGPLRHAGYRVVAPFLRGYGDSPAPTDPAAYTADLLADDVAGVIEACGEESAVVIGHDWGASVAWSTAGLRPDRVRAVVGLSVPFTARATKPPLERLAETFAGRFFYILYFQTPGIADAELASDVRRVLTGMYAGISGEPPEGSFRGGETFLDQLPWPVELPAWIDKGAFEEMVETFTRTGFTGPLNYYRAMDLTWHKLPHLGTEPLNMPALFLAGDKDPTLGFINTRSLGPPLLPDLRARVLVPGAGHWVTHEAPEAVNAALLEFLGSL